MFVLENTALWPLPLIAPVAAVGAVIWSTRRPRAGLRVLAVLLALAWVSVGWHFVWHRYALINWAMVYAAPAFVVQAALCTILAVRAPTEERPAPLHKAAGLGFVLAGAAVYPWLAVVQGRTLAGAEIMAVAPDPTAVASIGLPFLACTGRYRALLLLVPLAWLAQSSVTLFFLSGGAAAMPPALAVIAALGVVAGRDAGAR